MSALCVSAESKRGLGWTPDPSPLRRRCLSAVRNSHLDPSLHFLCYPRDPASAKRYPFGECARAFEPRDVSRTVGDAIDRFEFLLRYQLPCHRKSLVKGTLQRPVSQLTGNGSIRCYAATFNRLTSRRKCFSQAVVASRISSM